MTSFDDTPALRHLLTSYYHEDWTVDQRNYAEVVRDFIGSEPAELVVAAGVEARSLLDGPISDEMLEQSLGDVGCCFYLPGAGLTPREWLSAVAGMLEAGNRRRASDSSQGVT